MHPVSEILAGVDPAALGKRLRDVRRTRGLTQAELAGTDISIGYVSRIESGNRRPGLDVLITLADRLDTTAEELLTGVSARVHDEIRLGIDYAELALEHGEAADAERQARTQLDRAEEARLDTLAERARLLLGLAEEARGDIDGAIATLEPLLGTDPSLLTLRAGIAVVRCHREAGDLALALEAGEHLLGRIADTGLEDTDEAVQLTLTTASAHIERGDLHRAGRVCATAATAAERLGSPRARASAYWQASIVRSRQGAITDAVALADRALALLAEGRDARNLARLRVQVVELRLQQQHPDVDGAVEELLEARAALVASSASEIDCAHTDLVLAHAHLLAGDAEEALAVASAAPVVAGEAARQVRCEALVLQGQALAALGRTDEARQAYHDAVHHLTAAGGDRAAAQLWFELAELLDGIGEEATAREAYRSAATASGLVSRRSPVVVP